MKTRNIVLLTGLLSLLASSVSFAHGNPPVGAYGGGGLSGGVSVWVDPYGQLVYGGNLNYGSGYGYAAAPYYGNSYGHEHGPQCGHRSYYNDNRRHSKKYRKAYKHGYKRGHRNRHGYRDRH